MLVKIQLGRKNDKKWKIPCSKNVIIPPLCWQRENVLPTGHIGHYNGGPSLEHLTIDSSQLALNYWTNSQFPSHKIELNRYILNKSGLNNFPLEQEVNWTEQITNWTKSNWTYIVWTKYMCSIWNCSIVRSFFLPLHCYELHASQIWP